MATLVDTTAALEATKLDDPAELKRQRLRDKKQQTSVSSSKQVHSRPIPSQLARARPTSPNRPTSPDLA